MSTASSPVGSTAQQATHPVVDMSTTGEWSEDTVAGAQGQQAMEKLVVKKAFCESSGEEVSIHRDVRKAIGNFVVSGGSGREGTRSKGSIYSWGVYFTPL